MKCPQCGTDNQEGAKYCFRCGRTFPSNDSVAPASPMASAVGVLQTPLVKRRNYKKWILIVVGILALPLVVVFAAGVFASFFEAVVTDEQTFTEVQTVAPDIVPGSYVSPEGRFSIVFPNASPEMVQSLPFQSNGSDSVAYFVETSSYRFTVSELNFSQPIHVLDQRSFLEQWAMGFAGSQGGQLASSQFKDGEYLTLDIGISGPGYDTVARLLLADDSTAYALEYRFLHSIEPDVVGYTDFINSFRYNR